LDVGNKGSSLLQLEISVNIDDDVETGRLFETGAVTEGKGDLAAGTSVGVVPGNSAGTPERTMAELDEGRPAGSICLGSK
jgi:hypothetical protein